DPAVMSDHSYAAARQSRIAGTIANGSVFLDQGVERGGRDENSGAAVRGHRYAFDARAVRTGNLHTVVTEALHEAGSPDDNSILGIGMDSDLACRHRAATTRHGIAFTGHGESIQPQFNPRCRERQTWRPVGHGARAVASYVGINDT